jgi:hypothetical protein
MDNKSAAMKNFVFYCKTYSGDYDRFQKLVETFHQFNKDSIMMYVSVPKTEISSYEHFVCSTLSVITDESFAEKYMTDSFVGGIRPGYINQEICKLTFFKTNLCNNYLCLDSDLIFIRNFYIMNFMHSDSIPYTVLVMDKDLSVQKTYRKQFWIERQKSIEKIYKYVGLDDRRRRTCHGMQVFNTEVLESFEKDFMVPRQLSFINLLEIAPYEFTWYNVWFQTCKLVPEYAVEPFFKMLGIREDYIFSHLENIEKTDFAYAYVGIVMNSKWSPPTPLDYPPPPNKFSLFYKCIIQDENFIQFIPLKFYWYLNQCSKKLKRILQNVKQNIRSFLIRSKH